MKHKHLTIVKYCIDHGWAATRTTGGHLIMTKENKRSVPIPVHGDGLDIKIIMKELNQEPPKSKSQKFNTSSVDKPLEDDNPQLPSTIKPNKMPLESNGPEMFLSNDEASEARKALQGKKYELFNLAMTSFIEEENFVNSRKQLEELLKTYAQELTWEEKNEAMYLLALSISNTVENLDDSSEEYLNDMQKVYELCKELHTTDKFKTGVVLELMENVEKYFFKLVESVYCSVMKHIELDTETMMTNFKAFSFIVDQNIEVISEKLFFCGIAICNRLAKAGYCKILDKGWDFYRYAKSGNCEAVAPVFLMYVEVVMFRYRDNELQGSKFSNWNALMMLIAEARKYKDSEFDIQYMFFEQHVFANKDFPDRFQAVKEAERLVKLMHTVECTNSEDYLCIKMTIYKFAFVRWLLAANESVDNAGVFIKLLVNCHRYYEKYEKDFILARKLPFTERRMAIIVPDYNLMNEKIDLVRDNLFRVMNEFFKETDHILWKSGIIASKKKMVIVDKVVQSKIDNLRKSHKKEIDFILENSKRCGTLSDKKTYTNEEIDFGLQIVPTLYTLWSIVKSTEAPLALFVDSKLTHLEKRKLLETGSFESIAANFSSCSIMKLTRKPDV